MNSVVQRPSLDAFEEHGLFAYTKPEPQIAVDELLAFFVKIVPQ